MEELTPQQRYEKWEKERLAEEERKEKEFQSRIEFYSTRCVEELLFHSRLVHPDNTIAANHVYVTGKALHVTGDFCILGPESEDCSVSGKWCIVFGKRHRFLNDSTNTHLICMTGVYADGYMAPLESHSDYSKWRNHPLYQQLEQALQSKLEALQKLCLYAPAIPQQLSAHSCKRTLSQQQELLLQLQNADALLLPNAWNYTPDNSNIPEMRQRQYTVIQNTLQHKIQALEHRIEQGQGLWSEQEYADKQDVLRRSQLHLQELDKASVSSS